MPKVLVVLAVIGAMFVAADQLGSRTPGPTSTVAPITESLEATPSPQSPSATAEPPAAGLPCADHDRIAVDPATGQEVGCLERFLPSYEWVWQSISPSGEIHVRGTSCEGERAWSSARTVDGSLIVCQPADFISIDPIAGPGSLWSRPANI
jgi:hypothetical protein